MCLASLRRELKIKKNQVNEHVEGPRDNLTEADGEHRREAITRTGLIQTALRWRQWVKSLQH